MRCGIGLTDTRKEGPPAPSTRSTARPAKIPRLVHVCRGCHVDLRAPRSSSCRAIPETATLRLARTSSVCQALRYVAEIRLTAEGFANVALVGDAAAPTIPGLRRRRDGMLFLGPFLQRLAEGAPPSILAGGGHVDWLESFAYEPIRSVQDVAPARLWLRLVRRW